MPRFPADLPSAYYMSIDFMKYSRPSPLSQQFDLTPSQNGSDPIGGQIQLPVPANLVDSQGLNWASFEASLAAEMAMSGASAMFGQDAAARDKAASDLLGEAARAAPHLVSAIGGMLGNIAGQIAGVGGQGGFQAGVNVANDLTTTALQKAGLALNPMLTMLFKNPEFKTHQFKWRLVPNTPSESQTIREIVNQVRMNSLPDITDGAFFHYPSIAIIKVHNKGKQLYTFQPSVIRLTSAGYAPFGVPSWTRTGEPTGVDLQVDLVEIVLNTRKNYNPQGGSSFPSSLGIGPLRSLATTPAAQAVINRFLPRPGTATPAPRS